MDMNILVLNRHMAQAYKPLQRVGVISIYSPDDVPATLSPNCAAIHLAFSDLSEVQYLKYRDSRYKLVLFNRALAKKILDHVDELVKSGVSDFMVHCDAGVSRSPAVALALKRIYTGDISVPPAWGLYNIHVYTTMMEEYYENRI